jgi:hypothetical protein
MLRKFELLAAERPGTLEFLLRTVDRVLADEWAKGRR